jgi:hypothetical protein
VGGSIVLHRQCSLPQELSLQNSYYKKGALYRCYVWGNSGMR